jgi:molecular chaperone IbpA
MLSFNSASINHYPPYNIRKVNDTDYVIELAVAGFGKKDIEVKSVENTLTIKSKDKKEEVLDEDENILHRGISQRSFTRSFTVAEDVVVKGADLKDGLLSVKLERIIPDEKKPKIIDIK